VAGFVLCFETNSDKKSYCRGSRATTLSPRQYLLLLLLLLVPPLEGERHDDDGLIPFDALLCADLLLTTLCLRKIAGGCRLFVHSLKAERRDDRLVPALAKTIKHVLRREFKTNR
jgi:hypothetical protein